MTDRMAVAKAKAIEHLAMVLEKLDLRGPFKGRSHACCSPLRSEKNPSFVIWLAGPAAGGWKDYGGDDRGDIVDLVARLKGGNSKSGALRWLEDLFGLGTLSAHERRALEEKSKRERAVQAEKTAKIDEDARVRAVRQFKACPEISKGDMADVYLAGRRCSLFDVPELEPKTFRYDPAHIYWRSPDPHPRFPALLSCMRDGDSRFIAVHRTYVRADGSAKADVEKAKLIWPQCAGSTIRISRGPSGLSCEAAAAQKILGPMAIFEGVEDGATWAISAPEMRVHAAGSLSGLMSFPDFACADAYFVGRDNDWGKPQAAANFRTAMDRLSAFGKPIVVVPSPIGKDINDLVRSI